MSPGKDPTEPTLNVIQLPPGSQATYHPRKTSASGQVQLWIFDDQSKPLDPKLHRVGPRWGLIDDTGHMLVMGILYAPYLAGDTTYSSSEPAGKNFFSSVQYSALRREQGWHKWLFDFDADRGLSIEMDGSKVERFDWNATMMTGFCGVVLMGDADITGGQTFWAKDAVVTLGGPMRAIPKKLAPAFDLPETDPTLDKPAELLPWVQGPHPDCCSTRTEFRFYAHRTMESAQCNHRMAGNWRHRWLC